MGGDSGKWCPKCCGDTTKIKKCKECKGKGRIKTKCSNKKKDCQLCHGTGSYLVTCEECNAYGAVPKGCYCTRSEGFSWF